MCGTCEDTARCVLQEKEKEEKAQLDAVKEDDHMIKQMEKNLKLNKRKSKNLPQSFVNDGLDCILFHFAHVIGSH